MFTIGNVDRRGFGNVTIEFSFQNTFFSQIKGSALFPILLHNV